ncbi:MAG: NAD(P)H-hydrate epimerase, partial [Pseudomonadota bacterium]
MTAALLSVEEMYRADALAMAAGVSGARLMEAAGFAVFAEVQRRFDPCRVVVLCGPGNNGGDGFVAARHLAGEGYQVRVALLGSLAGLEGDAAAMARRWDGEVVALEPAALDGADVVVDALFGAGLSRPLDGLAREVVDEITRRDPPVVAVDVPSGVDGNTGAVLGAAPRAVATVTFFRKKPGHLLFPGRGLCGEVVVADIGIPADVLSTIVPLTAENTPAT